MLLKAAVRQERATGIKGARVWKEQWLKLNGSTVELLGPPSSKSKMEAVLHGVIDLLGPKVRVWTTAAAAVAAADDEVMCKYACCSRRAHTPIPRSAACVPFGQTNILRRSDDELQYAYGFMVTGTCPTHSGEGAKSEVWVLKAKSASEADAWVDIIDHNRKLALAVAGGASGGGEVL